MPVSYTHLDVYKRQPEFRNAERIVKNALFYSHKALIPLRKITLCKIDVYTCLLYTSTLGMLLENAVISISLANYSFIQPMILVTLFVIEMCIRDSF